MNKVESTAGNLRLRTSRFPVLPSGLGTFLTRTHRTYSLGTAPSVHVRAPSPASGIIMDKGQIAISRCWTPYKSDFISLSVQSDSNHVIPHKIFFAGSITI